MLASKTDLGSLKTKVDNLDVGKLKTVSADLRKLSIVVDNDVKKLYVKLVITVNAVDTRIPSTSRLVIKTHYDSGKQSYEKRILRKIWAGQKD